MKSAFICLLVASIASAASDNQTPSSDITHRADIRRDFERFNPLYKKLLVERRQRALDLGRQVFELEDNRADAACAHQILLEIKWLLGSTGDFSRIDTRLDDLQHALNGPKRAALARKQYPVDGSWGYCYTEWFFKLDATYDYAKGQRPVYPLRFLDRVNSPTKLQIYFSSIAVSDVARTGIDHRRELNEALADLLRLILHDRPEGYVWAPGMKSAMMRIVLDQVRSKQTGWWGERYQHDGKTYFVDDLSITFHMLSYLNGDVPDLGRVLSTALALKNLNYPQGWLEDGGYSNHNNMDAVVVFHYCWNSATPAQRKEIAGEIAKMLDWCLKASLQPDGSFRRSSDDDSIEESEYFGTAFLARAGFFDKARCFWTDREFPEAGDIERRIRSRIMKHLSSGATGGAYYKSALAQLDSKDRNRP